MNVEGVSDRHRRGSRGQRPTLGALREQRQGLPTTTDHDVCVIATFVRAHVRVDHVVDAVPQADRVDDMFERWHEVLRRAVGIIRRTLRIGERTRDVILGRVVVGGRVDGPSRPERDNECGDQHRGNGTETRDALPGVLLAIHRPRDAGPHAIGVHGNEGFALRVVGASFASASGGGIVDDKYREFLFNANNTADSNTRGVISNLAVGVYPVEFIGWERTGEAYVEIYAANGAYVDDTETADWKLIGEAGGLELVEGPPQSPNLQGIVRNGDVLGQA